MSWNCYRLKKLNGMVEGIGHPETARMLSSSFQRGRQFVAKFLYQGEPEVKKIKEGRSNLTAEQKKLWQAFAKDCLAIDLEGLYQCFGDQLYLLPVGLPDLKKVKIARNGLHLGTFKKNRFEPSFALGLALKPDQVKKAVSLSDQDFIKYVAGGDHSTGAGLYQWMVSSLSWRQWFRLC